MKTKKNSKKTKTTAKKVKKSVVKKVAVKRVVAKKKPIKKLIKKKTEKKKIKKIVKKKGVVIKKTSKKTKKVFILAPEERCFWVNNGPVLKNLKDLHKAFKSISKEQFVYHAHGKNNDFVLWVEYVLLDEKCAKDLKKAKTQKASSKIVNDAIKKYK